MAEKSKEEKDKLLEDLAKDYAPYFLVDTTAEVRMGYGINVRSMVLLNKFCVCASMFRVTSIC